MQLRNYATPLILISLACGSAANESDSISVRFDDTRDQEERTCRWIDAWDVNTRISATQLRDRLTNDDQVQRALKQVSNVADSPGVADSKLIRDSLGQEPAHPKIPKADSQSQQSQGQATQEDDETLAEISWARVFADFTAEPRRTHDSPPITVDRDDYFGSPLQQQFGWQAPNLVHRTLYFEDDNLERHGLSRCPWLQPTISGIRFLADFGNTIWIQPFQRPCELHFVSGHPHAGSCGQEQVCAVPATRFQ